MSRTKQKIRMLFSKALSASIILGLLITYIPFYSFANAQSEDDPTGTVAPGSTSEPANTPYSVQSGGLPLQPPLEPTGILTLLTPLSEDLPLFITSDQIIVHETAGLCSYRLADSQPVWCFNELEMTTILGVIGAHLFVIGNEPELASMILVALDLDSGLSISSFDLGLPSSESISCSSLQAGLAYCAVANFLLAIDVYTPSILWSVPLDNTVFSVLSKNEVVFASTHEEVVAYNAHTGEPVWQNTLLDGIRTPLLLADPGLVLGTADGQFIGLDPLDGNLFWSHTPAAGQPCSALFTDATLITSTSNGLLQRLDPFSAEVLWTYDTGGYEFDSCPALASVNGFLYLSGSDGSLRALELLSGAEVWSFALAQNNDPHLVLTHDKLVVSVGSDELVFFSSAAEMILTPTSIPTSSPATPEPTAEPAIPTFPTEMLLTPTAEVTPTAVEGTPEPEMTLTPEPEPTFTPTPQLLSATPQPLAPEELPEGFTGIAPASVLVGSNDFTLQLTGSGFNTSTILMWESTPLTTNYLDAATLRAAVPPDLLTTPGSFSISIFDSSTGVITATGESVSVIGYVPALGQKLAVRTVTFDWEDIPGAVQYRLQLALSDDFQSPLVDVMLQSSVYAHPKELLDSQTYYWRLSYSDGVAWSDWSQILHFFSMHPLPAPQLLTPDHALKTNYIPPPPALSWSDVPGADHYQVHVSMSSLFSTRLINQVTAPGELTLDFPVMPDGKYFWRVRAVDSVGVKGAWSQYRSFKVDTLLPAVPIPQKPANSAVVNTTIPRFTVSTVTGAMEYQFQVSTDTAFEALLVDATTTSILSTASYKLTGAQALPFGTFYWRARALDRAGNASNWTSPRLVLVDIKKTPSAGSILTSSRPTFTWGNAEGATSYRLQVATTQDFDPVGLIIDEALGSVDQFRPGFALPYGRYYWRIQAIYTPDLSAWTLPGSFVITAELPWSPTLAAPVTGTFTNDNTPRLRWIETFTITAPQLRVKNRTIQVYLPPDYQTSGKSYPVVYLQDGNTKFDYKDGQDYHVDEALELLYADGSIEGVIAVGVFYSSNRYDECSPWVNSHIASWNVPNAAGTEGGEGDAYINFLVNTLKPEIDRRYRTLPGRENTAIAGGSMGGLISLYGGLKRQDVFSRIIAFSPAVWFTESGGTWLSANRLINYIKSVSIREDTKFFLYVGTREWEGRPLYIYDSKGRLMTYPRVWVEGVQSVVNALLAKGHPAQRIKHVVNPGGIHEAESWQWWVDDALFWQFGGEVLPVTSAPPPSQPDGSRIQGYEVQISRRSNFSEIVHSGQIEQSLNFEPPPLLEDGRYYWRARAYNDLGVRSNWSLVRYIILDTKPPAVPVVYKPLNGALVTKDPPAFRVYAVSGAKRYQFQVAADAGFTELLRDKSVSAVLNLATFKPGAALPWGTFYWRARSVDAVGNASAWTVPQTITVNILKNPATGVVTTDTTPTFNWGSYGAALKYRLQVSRDAAFPDEEIVIDVKRASSSRSFTPALPLADGAYFWRMQIRTAAGWGEWTPPYSFNVSTKPVPPVLLAPASGTQTTTSPELSWDPGIPVYWNISHYEVQISDAPYFSTLIRSANIPDPFYTPAPLEAGTYFWRVRVVNALGVRSKWSAIWSFAVIETP